jgi:hypothetical protein
VAAILRSRSNDFLIRPIIRSFYYLPMKKFISFFALSLLLGGAAASSYAQDSTFHPSGKFSMQFFSDYDYVLSADTAGSGPKTKIPAGKTYYAPIDPANANGQGNIWQKFYQAFDIRRVYLGYDYQMSKDVSAQLLLSHENGTLVNNATLLNTGTTATYDSVKKTVTIVPGKTSTLPTSSSGDIVLDGNRGLYLKAANVQFKNWIPMSTVIFGQQGTAVFGVAEALWGYRSIEKTIMDMRGIAQSNDLGIQARGNIDNDKNYGYSLMISNGNGAKQENDKFKKVAIDLNGAFMDKHIWVDAYYDVMGLSDTSNQSTIHVALGYTSDMVSVGGEWFTQTKAHASSITTGNDATPTGFSVFARASIINKQLMVFARYDSFDPDSKPDASTLATSNAVDWKESFITAGLDWQPDMSVNAHVMPNIWMDTYKDKSSAAMDRQGITVGRMTFAYKF